MRDQDRQTRMRTTRKKKVATHATKLQNRCAPSRLFKWMTACATGLHSATRQEMIEGSKEVSQTHNATVAHGEPPSTCNATVKHVGWLKVDGAICACLLRRKAPCGARCYKQTERARPCSARETASRQSTQPRAARVRLPTRASARLVTYTRLSARLCTRAM
eukprot:4423450-Pleurochrysis_carterae.AAC.1